MSGLYHDFLLLPDVGDLKNQYECHINDCNAIRVHDDILSYFHDTLLWIPTENPANPAAWGGRGLNWYGPTAISGEGARCLSLVFEAWAELFSIGPDNIILTGAHSWTEGDSPDSGAYCKISIERSKIVSKCRAISQMALQASDSDRWLLHLGI